MPSGGSQVSMRIRLEKIREGIGHALRKSAQHLVGAEACLSIGSLDSAIGLTVFAIEEFGRAVVLRENLETGSEEVDKRINTNHDFKWNKAFTILPRKFKTIHTGGFDPKGFDPVAFDTEDESITHEIRMRAVYVDYDESNDEWITSTRVDKSFLKRAIEGIREHIKNFRFPSE